MTIVSVPFVRSPRSEGDDDRWREDLDNLYSLPVMSLYDWAEAVSIRLD